MYYVGDDGKVIVDWLEIIYKYRIYVIYVMIYVVQMNWSAENLKGFVY